MRRFYEQTLWIPQNVPPTNPDLHHGLLGIRNGRLSFRRVCALIRVAIYGRGYVVVSLAGDDRIVGVRGRSIQRSGDHRVRATRHAAAVYVVADRVSRRAPGEVNGVLSWRRS